MASAQSTSAKGDNKPTDPKSDQQTTTTEPKPAALEEDDEFEDFPVDDWTEADTEAVSGTSAAAAAGNGTQHLWEESWDDDDTTDDFSTQLKEELKKVDAAKKR